MRLSLSTAFAFVAGLGLTLASMPSAPSAQKRLRLEPIPRVLAEPFDLKGGTVQRLVLPFRPSHRWEPFQFQVELDGARMTIFAEPHNLRSDDFKVTVLESDGTERALAVPPPTSYRGGVVGLPGAIVAVNLFQGQLTGVILIGDETWGIQPANVGIAWLPRDAHVVYRQDQLEPIDLMCNVVEPEEQQTGPATSGRSPGRKLRRQAGTGGASRPPSTGGSSPRKPPYTAELAIELSRSYGKSWNGPEPAMRQASAILNTVDAIYRRDTDITFKITTFLLRDGGAYPNLSALGAMRNLWLARAIGIRRDLAHLFMPYAGGPYAGLAYLGTVCRQAFHYSASWDVSRSVIIGAAVTAHELGHTIGTAHCMNNKCYIMCAFIGGCGGRYDKFGTASANFIRNSAKRSGCVN